MLNAVWDAGIAVDEVNYINAHGTSTHHNDLFETRAIKLAFGAHAGEMKVNSTKSMVDICWELPERSSLSLV